VAFDMQSLSDDLTWSQVPDKSHLAGGAEDAAHGAPGLSAEAGGEAAGISHEHRLDFLAVAQAEKKLAGPPVGAGSIGNHFRLLQERLRVRVEPAPQRGLEWRFVQLRDQLLMKGVEKRVGMGSAHAVRQEFGLHPGKRQVMERRAGHGFAAGTPK
jgi:hypothetical protein